VPPGLSQLPQPLQARVEFLEIDPDMLAAATTGSAQIPRNDAQQADRMNTWLNEWSRDEMMAALKLIAQGQGHEAERQVKSRHAVWLKAHRPPSTPSALLRSVGKLRDLAQLASVGRLECEAKERAKQEAERRQQREAYLRLLMADVDKSWAAINAQAQRDSASGYEQAVRGLTELARATPSHPTRRSSTAHCDACSCAMQHVVR
jgi:hypothetical protein